jgi:hypothetical protein
MQLGSQKIGIPNPHGNQNMSAGLIAEIVRQAVIQLVDWDRA